MILESNLKFLSKGTIKKLENITYNSNEFELKISKDNLSVPIYRNNTLHSLYYPLKDSSRYNFQNDKKRSMCISIGFGAGYHLYEYQKNSKVLVVPINYDILYFVLSNIDISKYLENIVIISEDEVADYFNFIKNDDYFFVIHNSLERLFPEDTLQIVKNIKNRLNRELLDINTQKKFGRLWSNNLAKNISFYLDKKYSFVPLIIDKPILVVGAGPSLEKNIDDIKKYRDSLYIATTDTALRILLQNSILPNSVFNFDPQYYSHLHFFGVENTNIRIFSDITSSLRFNKNQTPLLSNHPFCKILLELGFSNIAFNTNPQNIGGSLVDFFDRYFGKISIISVGIDFGYYNFKSYSRGSYLNAFEIVSSNYFNQINNIDTSIFYRYIFNKNENGWKTNSLLSQYSENSKNDKISTLSDSPFVSYKKVNSIEHFLNSAKVDETSLQFNNPNLTYRDFIDNILSYIKRDCSPLLPLLMSKRLNIDFENIEREVNNFIKRVATQRR